MKDPAREQAVNERRRRKIKTTNTTASVTINEVNPKQNPLVSAVINDVQNSSRHKHPQSTQMIQYPSNRSQITAVVNVTNYDKSDDNNVTSVITYDDLGNLF